MKKIIIGIFTVCQIAPLSAMENRVPQILYTSTKTLERSRKSFKNYSYLDVAYATIPGDQVIDMKMNDPIKKKPLKDITDKDFPGFHVPDTCIHGVVARVATQTDAYYCNPLSLHEVLVSAHSSGIQNNGSFPPLPDLAICKDPISQEMISRIDYYANVPCLCCSSCKTVKEQLIRDLINCVTYKQEKIKPHMCDNLIMINVGQYNDIRNDLHQILTIRDNAESVPPLDIKTCIIKAMITVLSIDKHMGRADQFFKRYKDAESQSEIKQAISDLQSLEDWLKGRTDIVSRYIQSTTLVTLMKVLFTQIMEADAKGAPLNESDRKTYIECNIKQCVHAAIAQIEQIPVTIYDNDASFAERIKEGTDSKQHPLE